ncbi:PEP-CTERM motif protein [Symmachiella dynata]|uniref:PEP-CTERM motif protein n=1 Tax=Symmachiella dynata TaxID=2527995 RepID=A0A517ZUR0_9PLAN|nr:PEP-CTERM sorting domain-containing protein [Symmachiella dynata]QDU46223.1 PEP-CTERM motif protein [Symmachiella dynata]
MRSLLVAAVLTAVTSMSTSAYGGLIHTGLPTDFLSYNLLNPVKAAGSIFVADECNLSSFTLNVGAVANGGNFRAIVMDTVSGLPHGNPIWHSDLTPIPSSIAEVTFTPNIELTPGESYFIGFDVGAFTDATGNLNIGTVSTGTLLTDGGVFQNLLGLDIWTPLLDLNLATSIVMDCDELGDCLHDVHCPDPDPAPAVPEPSSAVLLGIGVLGLACHRWRRVKRVAAKRA